MTDQRDEKDIKDASKLIADVLNRNYQRSHIFMTEKEMLKEVDRLTKIKNPDVGDFARYVKHFILTGFLDVDGFLKKIISLLLVGPLTFLLCFALIASIIIYLASIVPVAILRSMLNKHQKHIKKLMVKNDSNLAAYNQLLEDVKSGKVVIIRDESDKKMIDIDI